MAKHTQAQVADEVQETVQEPEEQQVLETLVKLVPQSLEWDEEKRAKHAELIRGMYRDGKIQPRQWTEEERKGMSETLTNRYANGELVARQWTDDQKQAHRERMNLNHFRHPGGRKALEAGEAPFTDAEIAEWRKGLVGR